MFREISGPGKYEIPKTSREQTFTNSLRLDWSADTVIKVKFDAEEVG